MRFSHGDLLVYRRVAVFLPSVNFKQNFLDEIQVNGIERLWDFLVAHGWLDGQKNLCQPFRFSLRFNRFLPIVTSIWFVGFDHILCTIQQMWCDDWVRGSVIETPCVIGFGSNPPPRIPVTTRIIRFLGSGISTKTFISIASWVGGRSNIGHIPQANSINSS